jgi:hypothetical protein
MCLMLLLLTVQNGSKHSPSSRTAAQMQGASTSLMSACMLGQSSHAVARDWPSVHQPRVSV